jgi:hypothetical protein
LKKLSLFFALIPTFAYAEEPPPGVFTYLYAMSVTAPFIFINLAFIIYFLAKKRYRVKSLAAKQACIGLVFLNAGLIILLLNPIGAPYLADVVRVYMATFAVSMLPLLLHYLTQSSKK